MFNRAFGPAGVNREEAIATHNPLGRISTLEEVASAVLWLNSPGAAFTTVRVSSSTVATIRNHQPIQKTLSNHPKDEKVHITPSLSSLIRNRPHLPGVV